MRQNLVLRFLIFVIFSWILTACESNSVKPAATTIKISFSEPNRIRFQGKGAGAGAMLSSSMGPMGIAIGVAIDEGIAKDIQSTADQANIQIEELARKLAAKHLSSLNMASLALHVERYGFITQPGAGDPIAAEIIASLKTTSGSTIRVHYPKDFSQDSIKKAQLEEVKATPEVIQELFVEAFDKTLMTLRTQKDTNGSQ
ncbi:MAG: hypothetical protein AAGB12_02540 [Pseudomonadota bacterium]